MHSLYNVCYKSPFNNMHALSIPTWIIHISSVIEWIAAIWLIWKYGEVTDNRAWWALSLAMLPALISAMCACTWHYFDNAKSLEWLVTLQATMTLVGNCTLWGAAVLIWRSTQSTTSSSTIPTPDSPLLTPSEKR
jgi:hypothetical protein